MANLPSNDRFADQYGSVQNQRAGMNWPATECFPSTPSDILPLLQGPCRALYVGVGGALAIADCFDNPITLAAVATGTILPFRVKQVFATGTTASGLIALY